MNTEWRRRRRLVSTAISILAVLCKAAKVDSMAPMPRPVVKHRIELFFKDPKELKERLHFLHSHGFSAYNLVNKNKKDTVEEWVKCIHREIPDAHICAHYSLKYNKVARRGVDEHEAKLQDFVSKTQAQEILMISGSGKDTAWNTVIALDVCQRFDTKISVAYNPYFPDLTDQELEDQRLSQKISVGGVTKVYLQFGTNLDRLKSALEELRNRNVTVAGSLFLPTKQLIAQQKFRPWNGVFLSPEFLSSPENAKSIVVEMMKLYLQFNVEMLWEAPGIRTEKDLQVVFDLVEAVLGHQRGEESEIDRRLGLVSTIKAQDKLAGPGPTKRPKTIENVL